MLGCPVNSGTGEGVNSNPVFYDVGFLAVGSPVCES